MTSDRMNNKKITLFSLKHEWKMQMKNREFLEQSSKTIRTKKILEISRDHD